MRDPGKARASARVAVDMTTILLGAVAALAVSLTVRWRLRTNEREVDFERDYRVPPILGNWPNNPR